MKSKTLESEPSRRIGDFLRRSRREQARTPEEVAGYLGISPALLEDYESGEVELPLFQIYALANCLNLSPERVLAQVGKPLPDAECSEEMSSS